MKNLTLYYTAIIAPVLFIIWLSITDRQIWFMIVLLIYAMPYRTFIDGARLVSKKLIKWQDVWKLIIPGRKLEYTRDLYFKE
ncbi:MAG: hypothetical protein A2X13_07720 [Bacteroidetes bacterium GWC2_33_15]|nr:MAG: hypothetical protein A2X10_04775 [Bacteroidetes bacterium GWA2_33_15]OFX52641.1 MAG: hypothetical protein A2X13_07720 [Bacteroidetes bacterium GWC2_33_15]OFX64053.1 MAG: hypothetical protein A2X15_02615 [Bacteroidetes bacterium GWB2_32_14]OFX67261.1 MAG: hypothetical protein A2X14_11800 [Bacteroidetes bacterium GWD2_33_33]HAN18881.1 hypothetical protein [Bacteroidales bacterium]